MRKMLSLIVILFSLAAPLEAMLRRRGKDKTHDAVAPGLVVKLLAGEEAKLHPTIPEPITEVEAGGAGEAPTLHAILEDVASSKEANSRIGSQNLSVFLSVPRTACTASAPDPEACGAKDEDEKAAAPVIHRRSSIVESDSKNADDEAADRDDRTDKADELRPMPHSDIKDYMENLQHRSLRDRVRAIADANDEKTMQHLERIYNEVKNICLGYEIIRFKLQPLRRGEPVDPSAIVNLVFLMVEHYLLVAIQTKVCRNLKHRPEGIGNLLNLVQQIYLHWYDTWIKEHLTEKETLIAAIKDQVKLKITAINSLRFYSFIPMWLSEVDWARRVVGIATGYDLNFNNIETTREFTSMRDIYLEEFVQRQLKSYHEEEGTKILRLIDDIQLDDFFKESTTEKLMAA